MCIGLLITACTKPEKQSACGDQSLQGKYEIDFSSILSEINGDSEEEMFAKSLASMILSKIHMTMEFDGDQLLMDASGPVKNLVNAFGDAKMPYKVDYRIQNDSVLFIREHDEEEFKEFGVLRQPEEPAGEMHIVLHDNHDKDVLLIMHKL